MPREWELLKKEIRILGIANATTTGEQVIAVGVVFRGNRWLDGIVTCIVNPRKHDSVPKLACTILNCKQYSQIHAVIFTREWLSIWTASEFATLSSKTKLPVIIITNTSSTHPTKRPPRKQPQDATAIFLYRLRMYHRPLSVLTTKLNLAETHEILSITCSKGSAIPEAVRVAQLIAHRITNLKTTERAK